MRDPAAHSDCVHSGRSVGWTAPASRRGGGVDSWRAVGAWCASTPRDFVASVQVPSRIRAARAPERGNAGLRWASARRLGRARLRRAVEEHVSKRRAGVAAIAGGFALACAPSVPRTITTAEDLPALSDGAHFLALVAGGEDEHLGIAVAPIGDLDGDQRAELVLGTLRDARPGGDGPARVHAFSIAKKKVLWTLEGRDPIGADAFGERLAVVGDVDGDKRYDLAIGAWRAEDGRGVLDVRSGADGRVLARVHGMPPTESALGAAPSAVGDVDGDGSPDVAVSVNRSITKVFSAKDGRVLAEFAGTPISITGDLDLDGKPELLVFDGPPRDEAMLWRSDVRTARLVSTAKHTDLLRFDAGADVASIEAHGSAGDLDRDGFLEWIVAFRPNDTGEDDRVPGQRERRVRVFSGKTGRELCGFSVALPQRGRMHLALGVGDLDGDGVGEVLVSGHVEEGVPAAFVELHAFPSGKLVHRFTSSNWSFGSAACALPDQDGDGLAELVLGEYESAAEARCAGRVYVVGLARKAKP